MKILYVLGFLPTYVKREIEALSEEGVDMTVLLPSENSGSSTSDFWQSITEDPGRGGVATLRVMPFHLFLCSPFKLCPPLSRSLKHLRSLISSLFHGEFRYFLAASETLKKLPQGWKPDVIHTHFAGDQAHVARIISRFIGVPYTVTTHATDIFAPGRVERLKRVLRDAAEVLTISEYNRRYLRDNDLYQGEVTVAKLGIDTDSLPVRKTVHEKQIGVCTASGLVEKKGVDVLIKAADMMKKGFPDLRFRVIGSDPDGIILANYREKVRDLPVEFTGALSSSETLEAVACAGFFVLPCIEAGNGDKDGIPVALMEAMGMGVPSVSTSLSGIPELIVHGTCGFLADPGSPESLVEMIKKILGSPDKAEAMGKRGIDRVRNLHSPEISAKKLMKVLERVVKNTKEKLN